MHTLWITVLYQPIYNTLFFLINHITFGSVGVAVIILTVLVKLVISPLTRRSIRTQILMNRLQPEIKRIKQEYPNKEEQAKKTFELYKKYGTSPFAGCIIALLQFPFIIALYYTFIGGFKPNPDLLYSFVQMPGTLHMIFLGMFDLGSNSIVLAFIAGIAQFIQGYLSLPVKGKTEIVTDGQKSEPSFQDQLQTSMQNNIRYLLPIFIAILAYRFSAAVALYWITSTIFTIVQEWLVRRKVATMAL